MMNVPPPPTPTSRGNRQMFPVPTAIPIAATTNAKRLEKTSRFTPDTFGPMLDHSNSTGS
jgi:hypothetical protein